MGDTTKKVTGSWVEAHNRLFAEVDWNDEFDGDPAAEGAGEWDR